MSDKSDAVKIIQKKVISAYNYSKEKLYEIIDNKLHDKSIQYDLQEDFDYDNIHKNVDQFMLIKLRVNKQPKFGSSLSRRACEEAGFDAVTSAEEVFEQTIYANLPQEYIMEFMNAMEVFEISERLRDVFIKNANRSFRM